MNLEEILNKNGIEGLIGVFILLVVALGAILRGAYKSAKINKRARRNSQLRSLQLGDEIIFKQGKKAYAAVFNKDMIGYMNITFKMGEKEITKLVSNDCFVRKI